MTDKQNDDAVRASLSTDGLERMVKDAGFKVFGDKIVAADDNNSGLATESVKRLIELVRADERQACWDDVNAWIKRGKLQGNGCDETAQRNGMILASNILMERIVRSNV